MTTFRKPIFACFFGCALFVLSSSAADIAETALCLPDLGERGAKVLPGYKGAPVDGVLATFSLTLPPFKTGLLFADYAIHPWPAADNRALPWVFGTDLGELYRRPLPRPPQRQNIFTVLALEDGTFLALLPLTGPETMSWLETLEDGRLAVRLGTLGTAPVECDAPLLAWARAVDVYQACREAWEQAVEAPPVKGRVNLRSAKTHPEPFRYLGWCSWEHHKKDISASLLQKTVDQIEAGGTPVRWLLVDDGHQTLAEGRMASLAPDAKKFPDGWSPLLARRRPDKIRWMGVWHAFNGIFGNLNSSRGQLALANQFGALDTHLQPYSYRNNSFKLSRPDAAAATAWFDALIGSAAGYGFDFVKIDAQSRDLLFYRGDANAVRASALKSQALESAVERHGVSLINCMAISATCLFNTRLSSVTRCSSDYIAGDLARGRAHILHSFHATLVLGQTVWPDHDMFHSSDPAGGRPMALSKALSGAPIYLSDDPKDFHADHIRPLSYADGELLRPLAPGVPLPDSLFLDPLTTPAAYRVIAPLPHGCAAVALFQLGDERQPATVQGEVRADDYTHASALIQPVEKNWTVPTEGLVAWNWYEQRGGKLDAPLALSLTGFSDQLVLLCPITQGWAVVGRVDKYLSPAAVTALAATADRLELTLVESGPFVVWSATGRPRAAGVTFADAGHGFWRAELPPGQRNYRIVLNR